MAEKDLTESMYRLDDFLSRVDHEMNEVCFLKFNFYYFLNIFLLFEFNDYSMTNLSFRAAMTKTSRLFERSRLQSESNWSKSQNSKLKQRLKQRVKKSQKTTPIPNPIKTHLCHSNFSFQLMPIYCTKLVLIHLFHIKISDG